MQSVLDVTGCTLTTTLFHFNARIERCQNSQGMNSQSDVCMK